MFFLIKRFSILLAMVLCLSTQLNAKALLGQDIKGVKVSYIPFLEVNPNITKHKFEKRGFVEVPLKYDEVEGNSIGIFYRLIPTTNTNKSAPILAIINGGPGSSSWWYHPIDFDYENENSTSEISELRKFFRILLVDQRGTGYSAPLDLNNALLSATVIAEDFDYDNIAKDHALVIKHVVPASEKYFLLARSYGGVVGLEYLIKGYRKPAGFIFSSIIQPHLDPVEVFSKRREKQKLLNLKLRASSPSTVKKLNLLRERLLKVGLKPERVNVLWNYLGKNVHWISELDKKLNTLLLLQDAESLKEALSIDNIATISLLNYVLSSKSLTPGYTDATMTKATSQKIPFESWMIDENWTLNQLAKSEGWKGRFIKQLDENPPKPSFFPPIDEINEKVATNEVLFTFGRSDSFLNFNLMSRAALRFDTGDNVRYKAFEGGHGAAFSKIGAIYVSTWANEILNK